MTTFADREHAIEAHYAARELAAFRERSRRHRRLGYRLAALLNLHGKEARQFAVRLSQQCIGEPSDEKTYRRMASALGQFRLRLSDGDHRRTAIGGGKTVPDATATPQSKRSWIVFVTTELMALFTVIPGPAGAIPRHSHATPAPWR
jgi:hypothetical protein